MKASTCLCLLALLLASCSSSSVRETDDGWISLFDGTSLDGWRASENPSTFSVEDGAIVAHGPRAHLFYVGPVMDHDFKNFEFKADVMTTPGSNSGIYFHTEYQDEGWPAKGYETQVNNTQSDPRKTASLYAVSDVNTAPAEDDEWFTMYIKVDGRSIVTAVDGETVIEYVEPEDAERSDDMQGRRLASGTFALQGHDPDSRVLYRNIMVRPLPE